MKLSAPARRAPVNEKTPCDRSLGTSRATILRAVATFIAERTSGDLSNQTHVRTHALSRAEIESPRARVPYIAGWEFCPATAMRGCAPRFKRQRYPVAYGVG